MNRENSSQPPVGTAIPVAAMPPDHSAAAIEPERYELFEPPRSEFTWDRRDFFRLVGSGIVVCLAWHEAPGQPPGAGRQRGAPGATGRRRSARGCTSTIFAATGTRVRSLPMAPRGLQV